jgi:hypothetical protein
MSARRRQGPGLSLFPFLAVLVCTLGTLILLLALVAQNATDAAAREQAAAGAERLATVQKEPAFRLTAAAAESLIDEEKFRVAQLVAFRDEQTSELGNRKDQLTHLEDHIQRLRGKLQQISQAFDIATGEQDAEQPDARRLVRLRDEVERESERVRRLGEAKKDAAPRVVIVPHKGPNGTDRRPIYLECDAAGLTIWPEGTRITMEQLSDSSFSANPLDAALRVIRHHATRHYGDASPPYPLLVVRPDGIETYSEARRAMLDWDDQFGYELIPAEVKLAFNRPDRQLRQRIELAVRDAVLKQQARRAIVSRSGFRPGYLADRPGQLNGTTDGKPPKRFPVLSAKSMDQAGRASGFRDHRDHHFSRSRYAASAYGTSGSHHGNRRGTGADAAHQLDQRLRTAVGELTDGGSTSLPGPDIEATGPERTARQASPSDPAGGPDQGEQSPTFAALEDASSSSQGNMQGFAPEAGDESVGTPADRDAPAGVRSNSGRFGQDQAGRSAVSGQASMSPPPTTGQGGTASPSDPMTPPQPSPPSIRAAELLDRGRVRREGADWALPREVARSHGNAIVRTIRVQCFEDRLVLMPPPAGGATEFFGFADGEITRATLDLATAVRDRIERWGAAIPGGRWQPRLDVEVMPGGQTRFHQLRTLMRGSGVEVNGRASP